MRKADIIILLCGIIALGVYFIMSNETCNDCLPVEQKSEEVSSAPTNSLCFDEEDFALEHRSQVCRDEKGTYRFTKCLSDNSIAYEFTDLLGKISHLGTLCKSNFCADGVCWNPDSCRDDEGKKDYYDKGAITLTFNDNTQMITLDDDCNRNMLIEWSCIDQHSVEITGMQCDGGCVNGACQ